jgi:hypothetical protein
MMTELKTAVVHALELVVDIGFVYAAVFLIATPFIKRKK